MTGLAISRIFALDNLVPKTWSYTEEGASVHPESRRASVHAVEVVASIWFLPLFSFSSNLNAKWRGAYRIRPGMALNIVHLEVDLPADDDLRSRVSYMQATARALPLRGLTRSAM